MKRFVLLTLFFYACTFARPPQAHALYPLGIIPASQIGLAVAAIAAGSAVTKVAINNAGSWEYDTNNLTAPLVFYNDIMQAGAQMALGAAYQGIFDLEQAYNQGLLQAQTALAPILDTTVPPVPPSDLTGSNVACGTANAALCSNGKVAKLTRTGHAVVGGSTTKQWCLDYIAAKPEYWYSPNTYLNIQYRVGPPFQQGTLWYIYEDTYAVQYVTGVPTVFPRPVTLPQDRKGPLGQGLADSAAANPNAKNALDTIVGNNPNLVAKPDPITQKDIEAWAQNAAQTASQQLIDELTALVAANPDNAVLKAALAQALADAAQQKAEDAKETFPPLAPSGFATPYNPGTFDIPARFTTFLNRVKSTGLFSFSSGFFNSLPGGGSPVYQINAGQYGTHSIDLSLTMGTGLAILKTILLACFGFLSIRAVILKR